MSPPFKWSWSLLASIGQFLLWAAVFSISFTQWPLYSENQNTKFLNGLAKAGMGYLNEDWLANTIDPLPAFTSLVYITHQFSHQNLFYLYHGLLLGIYLLSLILIANHVFLINKTALAKMLFGAFIVASHSSLLLPFSAKLGGSHLGWILNAGVANQYLLNPVLQPSTFGVLLILSIALFLHEKPYWAAASAAIASIFHSAYLPSTACLTLSYMLIVAWQTRRLSKPLGIGLIVLALIAPILAYNYLYLGPTNAALWESAQNEIVNFRIPHHSRPEVWLNSMSYVKAGIVVAALFVVARSQLLPIMLTAFLVAVSLTWLQLQIDWDTLAFTAPWRISVFLVPLATTMLAAFVISIIFNHLVPKLLAAMGRASWQTWIYRVLAAVVAIWLLAMVGRGAQAIQSSFAERRNNATAALWEFGWNTRTPGQIYLVPTHMAEFRLHTGLPIVVTFKSHPYKDTEVIEWRQRINAVNDFYANINCSQIESMVERYNVTHVVLSREQFFDGCPIINNIHLDEHYGVFAVVVPS